MSTTATSPAAAAPTARRSAFSRELRHEIEIDAPAERVWQALTKTADYSWNPFIHRLEGKLAVGEKLQVEIEPPEGRVMTFKPTVLEVEPARKLRWLGHFLLPKVLDGEHSFELQPLSGDRTRLVQSERFSGILVGLLSGTLDKTEHGFAAMNAALKSKVEGEAT
jgi:hypothetical protein